MAWIGTEPTAQIAGMPDIPEYEIGASSDFEHAAVA